MLPISLLMNEHGIVTLMISLMKEKVEGKPQQPLTSDFIEIAVDFFRMYADRCHHGKEEGILFRELAKKRLSSGHKLMMEELIKEHIYARETVNELATAQKKFVQGKPEGIGKFR